YENALLHPARLGCHFLLCICIFTIITGKITRQLAILTQPRCEFIGPLGRSLCRSLSLCVRRLAEKESHSGRSDFLVGVRQAVSGQSEFLAHNSGTGRVRFRDAHSGDTKVGDCYAACIDETGAETVNCIEAAMEQRIEQLDWMNPETKAQALTKLHGIRNKIGYPDKWRDYSLLKIVREDFADLRSPGAAVREPPRYQQNWQTC